MRLISILLIAIILGGCVYDPPRATLTIHNYSDSAIYVYETCTDSLAASPELKLFLTWPGNRADAKGRPIDPIVSPDYRVNAYAFSTISVGGNPEHKRVPCKGQDYVNLFFISELTMKTNTWQKIYEEQLYQNKISLTNKQLDSLNWEVKYVPSTN